MLNGARLTTATSPEQAPIFIILDRFVSFSSKDHIFTRPEEMYIPVVAAENRLDCNVWVYDYPLTLGVDADARLLGRVLFCHKRPNVAFDTSSAVHPQCQL